MAFHVFGNVESNAQEQSWSSGAEDWRWGSLYRWVEAPERTLPGIVPVVGWARWQLDRRVTEACDKESMRCAGRSGWQSFGKRIGWNRSPSTGPSIDATKSSGRPETKPFNRSNETRV